MLTDFRSLVIFVFAIGVSLSSCAANQSAEKSAAAHADIISTDAALVCKTAADCAIKNVGNCCGYYPACVHQDQPVDLEAVQARCAKEGISSICGFPEISACACVDGQCVVSSTGNGSGDPRLP